MTATEKSEESILYRNLQLKFGLFGDPLFADEETRWLEINRRRTLESMAGISNINANYMLDLDFQNIKNLTYKVEKDT